MKLLKVTNIQRGCVYDGPGVRTTVFLKGCTLRCPWCCNPESISYDDEWFLDNDKCLLIKGRSSKYCELCERNNGSKSINECPFGVAIPTSDYYNIEELFDILIKDVSLYFSTNGGVTFSGGEPLLNAETLIPLLKMLFEKRIHVAFETTLLSPPHHLSSVSSYVNCFLVDLKLQPQLYLNNHKYIEVMKERLNHIRDKDIYFRMVYVDDMKNKKESVLYLLKMLNVDKIDILLCHSLGKKKYEKLSMEFVDYSANRENAKLFCGFLMDNGICSDLLTV